MHHQKPRVYPAQSDLHIIHANSRCKYKEVVIHAKASDLALLYSIQSERALNCQYQVVVRVEHNVRVAIACLF